MRFCSNCGANISDEVRFCARCGAVAPNNMQYPSPPYDRRLRKKPRGQTGGIVSIIASGLVVILLFELVIGPKISGRTLFDGAAPSNQVLSTGSAAVSPDNPVAKIDGVTVDFGDNLSSETELSIQTGTIAPDNEQYTGIDFYDFKLEGQSAFTTLVDITLPNTAEPDEAFYVAYQSEETGKWENIPFENEGDEVTFSTRHFSRYALIKYYRDRYVGPLTPLMVNYDEVRKALAGIDDEDLFQRVLEEKLQLGSNEYVNKAFSVGNDLLGAASLPYTYDEIVARMSGTVASKVGNYFTAAGALVTALKVVYQIQAQDSYDKVLKDNIFDVCEVALAGAAIAIPSSVVLPVAAVLVFGAGLVYDYTVVPAFKDDSLQYAYRAYNDYCMYPHIAYDKNRAKELAEGSGEDSPWIALETYNADTEQWVSTYGGAGLLTLNQSFSGKWEEALMGSYTLYEKDPKAMQERTEALVDEYLDVFWALEGGEQIQFAKSYCGIAEENWRWPDGAETQQMKNAIKAELLRDLRPVFEDVQETIVEDMKTTLLQNTDALVEYLNTEISFEIVDPAAKKEGFENTRVKDDIIRFEPVSSTHQNDWVCQPDRWGGDTVFCCTLYNYLKEGSPDKVCFYKTEADLKAGAPYMTLDMRVEMPVTRIVLQDQSAYVWALTSIEPTSYLGSLDSGMRDENGLYEMNVDLSVSRTELTIGCSKDTLNGFKSAQARLQYPAMIIPDVEGGLTVSAAMLANTFVDHRGDLEAVAYVEYHDPLGYKIAATREPGGEEVLTMSPLPQPGDSIHAGNMVRNGMQEHVVEVGISVEDGMGVPPRYGVILTYTWMSYEEAMKTAP